MEVGEKAQTTVQSVNYMCLLSIHTVGPSPLWELPGPVDDTVNGNENGTAVAMPAIITGVCFLVVVVAGLVFAVLSYYLRKRHTRDSSSDQERFVKEKDRPMEYHKDENYTDRATTPHVIPMTPLRPRNIIKK